MNNNRFYIYVGFVIMAILASCRGIKPGGATAGNKLYETFFVGEEGSQYFIKPIALKNENKERLLMDFTFRYKDDVKDSTLVNFTIVSQDNIKSIDQIVLENGVVSTKSDKVALLFIKRENDGFHGRFTCKVSLTEISELYSNSNWKISAISGQDSKIFYASSKSQKKIEALNYNVFQVFK